MVSLPDWLRPPSIDGGEEAERLRTAFGILLTGSVVLGLALLGSVLLRPLPLVGHVDYAAMLALHLATLLALRKLPARPTLTGFACLYLFLAVFAMVRTGAGLTPAGFVLPPIVLFMALTVGGKEALVTAVAASLAALVVVAADAEGLLPASRPMPTTRLWLVATTAMIMVTYMTHVALEVIRTSRARSAAEQEARRRLEGEVERTRRMEAVGRLAAGAAHDFNNVLTVVMAEADRIRRRGDPSSAASAESILEATKRATALTRQLLTFGRRGAAEPAELDLAAVIRELAPLLRQFVGERATLDLRLEEELPPVRADRVELEQVLLNLVTNARDAMPEGGTITIAVARVGASTRARSQGFRGERPALAVSVGDTGLGMTEEVLARLFEPFFTTKEVGRGTGLGLSTVRDIVTRAGGEVLVTSELGVGTTVTVLWPA